MDIYQESLELHRKSSGKISLNNKINIKDRHDLSMVYTPGVAEACRVIHKNKDEAYHLTIKSNMVAVVTDGSAVLGLGNIGPEASLPVMEGKAMLFKEYAGVDAFPICLSTQDSQEIIHIVKNIAPVFSGINLEDISAPRCFEIEDALQDIGIPVFHDDQHGTAIVTYAALINACKLTNKKMEELKVVINGAGAAGKAIKDLIMGINYPKNHSFVKNVIVCDSKGIIHTKRPDVKNCAYKLEIARTTNPHSTEGDLYQAMNKADVFIGVSVGGVVSKEMIGKMNEKSIVLAMANPTPEIMPDQAKDAGAYIIGTGRSDFPNQVNNVLAFPGIFKGAIQARARKITSLMKLSAAIALADYVKDPSIDNILPSALDKNVATHVADYVAKSHAHKNLT